MPSDMASFLPRLHPDLVYAAEHQPNLMHPDPAIARQRFRRALRVSQALRGAPDFCDQIDVTDHSFRAYGDSHKIVVRIYRRRSSESVTGVLVFFHGALLAGDLETEHTRCLRFAAEADCIVVSVAYRLPPEHPFPTPTNDCYAAVSWVCETARQWGGDPTRIAVGGSSSGALLAAAVALMARDRGTPRIALQMLLYPTLDDRQDTASVAAFSLATKMADDRYVWRHYLGAVRHAATSPYAVPARCSDFSGVAPAYILVADIDPLRDEALDYATRMMQDGVSVEVHVFARTFHGFDAAAPQAAPSVRSSAEQCAVLRRALAASRA